MRDSHFADIMSASKHHYHHHICYDCYYAAIALYYRGTSSNSFYSLLLLRLLLRMRVTICGAMSTSTMARPHHYNKNNTNTTCFSFDLWGSWGGHVPTHGPGSSGGFKCLKTKTEETHKHVHGHVRAQRYLGTITRFNKAFLAHVFHVRWMCLSECCKFCQV